MSPSVLTSLSQLLSHYTKEQEILVPPVTECVDCGGHLTNNHSTSVKVYTLSFGAADAQKFTLCCRKCGLFYNYSMYGNKSDEGFRYYERPRKYVEVLNILKGHQTPMSCASVISEYQLIGLITQ